MHDSPPPPGAPLKALLEELRAAWRAGRRAPVEAYLGRHPALANDRAALLELLTEELYLRQEAGEVPASEEYLRRFPALGDDLRRHLAFALAASPPTEAPAATAPLENRAAPDTAPPLSPRELLAQIDRFALLEPPRRQEVERLAAEPAATSHQLGRELMRRGWMTAFQLNHLLTGRGGELLLGDYLLTARLGRGGMGQVFQARHRAGGQAVALKVIRAERSDDPDAVRRFLREARMVARLDHPHIVRALDAGRAGGTHYLVMEYIDGMDAARYLSRRGAMPIPAACEVARQAALGLQHAHERGLVHRDIKPSNLMLARPPQDRPDAFPVVKVLDLGLARRSAAAADDSTTLTGAGMMVGTPDYVAPEQIGDARSADARADLYSLGCTLYHLLAGRPPFAGGTTGQKLVQHQSAEPTPLVDLRPEIPSRVSRLVRRLMAKRPEDRPGSAAEVAAELKRLLRAGGLGQARPFEALAGDEDGIVRAMHHWRGSVGPSRRALLLAGGIAAGLLLACAALALWLARPGRPHTADPPSDPPVDPAAASPLEKLRYEDLTPAQRVGWHTQAGVWPDRRLVQVLGGARGRQWGPVNSLAVSADGKRIASGSRHARQVTVWDAETLEPVGFLRTPGPVFGLGCEGGEVLASTWENEAALTLRWRPGGLGERFLGVEAERFSPDGTRALASCGTHSVLRDARTGRELLRVAERKGAESNYKQLGAAFSPDGKQAFLPGRVKGDVLRADARTGEVLETFATVLDSWPEVLAPLPGGKGLLVGGVGGVRLVEAGKKPRPLGATRPADIAVSPDGKRAAWADLKSTDFTVWDLERDRGIRRFAGKEAYIERLAFLSDARLVTGDHAGNLRLWDVEAGKELLPRRLPPSGFHSLAFSPTGDRVVASGARGWLGVFDTASKAGRFFKVEAAEITSACFSPDGKGVLVADTHGKLRLHDAESGQVVRSFPVGGGSVYRAAYSPDGGTIFAASGSSDVKAGAQANVVRAFDPQGRERFRCVGHNTLVHALAVSEDRLLTGSDTGFSPDEVPLRLWDARTGKQLRGWPLKNYRARALALAPDGRWAVSTSSQLTLDYFDLDSASAEPAWSRKTEAWAAGMGITPDGRIVVALYTGQIQVWTRTGEKVAECELSGQVAALAVSPDGKHVATANADGKIYIIRLPAASRRR